MSRYPCIAVFRNSKDQEVRRSVSGDGLDEILVAARREERSFADKKTRLYSILLNRSRERRPLLWCVDSDHPEGLFLARAEEYLQSYDERK